MDDGTDADEIEVNVDDVQAMTDDRGEPDVTLRAPELVANAQDSDDGQHISGETN